MHLCIFHLRQRLYELVPVGQVLKTVMLETFPQRSVEVLDWAIGQIKICSYGHWFSAYNENGCLEELGHELLSVVSQQVDHYSARDDPVMPKTGGYVRGGYCIDRYGFRHFSTSVGQENSMLMAELRPEEPTQYDHCDKFEQAWASEQT